MDINEWEQLRKEILSLTADIALGNRTQEMLGVIIRRISSLNLLIDKLPTKKSQEDYVLISIQSF